MRPSLWYNAEYFYPRSPCGERRKDLYRYELIWVFLSTLSLRRATCAIRVFAHEFHHFYPRSPCGERRQEHQDMNGNCCISIHALLAESDHFSVSQCLSPHNFYPRSPCGERHGGNSQNIKRRHISIHALLAESDHTHTYLSILFQNFYPRSPCGERLIASLT